MVDLAVSSQLQQWTFEKPGLTAHPQRSSSSSSSASSPNLCDDAPETLRIGTSTTGNSSPKPRKESVALQDRYMSSEEDLSPADGSDSEIDYDDVVVHDVVKECKARTMSISRWHKGKSCDMAVTVSYSFAGRPKVVELDCRSPTTEQPMAVQQRSASLANLPIAAINKLQQVEAAQRLSMKVLPTSQLHSQSSTRSNTPPVAQEPRRPSTSHSPITRKTDSPQLTDTASTTSSFKTAPSSRSSTSMEPSLPSRPLTSAYEAPSSSRSSVYIPTHSRTNLTKVQTSQSANRLSQWAPPAPASPATHAFLSSDPYETSTANSASPIIKPAAHKRLRSISMKLALAKIAISPSKKTYDARINGKVPPTPQTPMTPQTAPIEGSASFASPPNRLRRASTILRPKSRHGDSTRGPSPETAPPLPTFNPNAVSQNRMTRMVARGASEIEPTLVLPPCPSDTDDDIMSTIKTRKLKKRKSLMSLMDSL